MTPEMVYYECLTLDFINCFVYFVEFINVKPRHEDPL